MSSRGRGPRDSDDDDELARAETVSSSGDDLARLPTVVQSEAEAATVTPTSRGMATPQATPGSGGDTSPSSRGTISVGPGTTLGRFQIIDELGAGGMATVFRARDAQLRREVAIKVMFPHLARKPEVARRFQREARAAAGLEHPNILRVYDVGGGRVAGAELDEPPHIVMELIRGRSLRDVIEATGPMLAEVVACIGAVLCEALAAAHKGGVIHRDVKPGNVMISEDGRLLLADFGVARIENDDSLMTKTGALLGTPSFMSPEQAHGDDLDGRGDVYSVGATLYQLATGSLPFAGPTAVVIAAITRGEFTAPQRRRPQVGSELGRAIASLMAVDRANRPATADAAAKLLRQVATDGGFGEPRDEIAAYFADPDGFENARKPKVVARLVERARAALEARAMPRAMGLLDRVLAMEPDHVEAQALSAQIGRRSGRRRGAAIAAGVAAVVALGSGGVWLATRPDPPRTAAVTAADADAAAAPDAAAAADADAAADAAAAAAADAAVGFRRDGGTAKPRGDAAPPPPIDAAAAPTPPVDAAVAVVAPPDAAAARAFISVAMDTWCDLSVDGIPLGRADPKKRYELDPGRHQVVCTQGQGMAEWRGSVTLTAGEHEAVRGSLLADVRVTVAVKGATAVRIGGKTHKQGATVELRPGRQRVEVLDDGEVVATGWVSFPRVFACTLKSDPDLDCY